MERTSQSSSLWGGTREVRRGIGRVELEVGEEAPPGGVPGGDDLQALQVPQPRRGVVVEGGEVGLVEPPHPLHLGGEGEVFGLEVGEKLPESFEVPPGGRRPGEEGDGLRPVAVLGEVGQGPGDRHRPHPLEELQDPEPGELVPGVFRHPEERQGVLDVRRLHELEAPVLAERDPPPGELHFEGRCGLGGPEQDRLVPERHPRLVAGENLPHDELVLGPLVPAGHKPRPRPPLPPGPEVLRVPLPGLGDQGVGRGEDGHRRAVVLLQGHDPRSRELPREVEDVPHRGRAEAVDALGVVPHHGHVVVPCSHPPEDLGLQPVRVLVLVDKDVVELGGELPCKRGVGHHLPPVEEEVVEVEDPEPRLPLDVGPKEGAEILLPGGRPREVAGEDHPEVFGPVDHAGVDGEAGPLPGEALLPGGEPELVAEEPQEVLGVPPVEDGEVRAQAHGPAVEAEEAAGGGVERAAPDPTPDLPGPAEDALGPGEHLLRRPAGEGEEENPVRGDALGDEVGDPIGEGPRLARSRAGHDEEGAFAVGHRLPLGGVEVGKPRELGHGSECSRDHLRQGSRGRAAPGQARG